MRLALAAGGLLLAAQIVLLLLQLNTLRDSHQHIRAQDAKIAALLTGARPVLDEAEPLARSARRAIRPLGKRGEEIAAATDVLPGLALTARELAAAAAPAVERLPHLVALADRLLPEMRAVIGETLDVQRRTLARQEEGVRIQRAALRILRQSRAIQQESLKHVRSLDRKTGGDLPG